VTCCAPLKRLYRAVKHVGRQYSSACKPRPRYATRWHCDRSVLCLHCLAVRQRPAHHHIAKRVPRCESVSGQYDRWPELATTATHFGVLGCLYVIALICVATGLWQAVFCFGSSGLELLRLLIFYRRWLESMAPVFVTRSPKLYFRCKYSRSLSIGPLVPARPTHPVTVPVPSRAGRLRYRQSK